MLPVIGMYKIYKLFIIFKQKKIIISFFLIVVSVVSLRSFTSPGIYEAESKILVEKETSPEKALLFRMTYPQNREKFDFVNAEMEIMQSNPVLSEVVETFQLDQLKTNDKPLTSDEKKDNFAIIFMKWK